ncbi:MAG: AAA family ATPase, partial [Lachnospiraceae bacterium]|nr:AAA family ATPase [Lachnospiraceae bacterium]
MLKRKVDDSLTAWKNKPDRRCLMIRGARQIGKTTSVRNFGKKYGSFIEINFLKNPGLSDVFSGNLDADTLLLNFSLYLPDAVFVPGDTLLFLDEIQECPNAITSLKFWMEDRRFDVIASGSMLGIDYKRPVSYPVGSVDYIDMYPMSFE